MGVNTLQNATCQHFSFKPRRADSTKQHFITMLKLFLPLAFTDTLNDLATEQFIK